MCCRNYKGIKLMCHTMELWERVVKDFADNRGDDQWAAVWLAKSTTDSMFA